MEYIENLALDPLGRLAVYTTQAELLQEIIAESEFKEVKGLKLKIATSSGAYLYPYILVYQKPQ